jgi:hypothetical protein
MGIKDTCGIDLPPPARKTIDLEGRIVKDVSGYSNLEQLGSVDWASF